MNQPWIVYERHGGWASAARASGANPPLTVRETRSLEETTEALLECPQANVVLEVRSDNVVRAAHWLSSAARRWPSARLGVVTSPAMASAELALRDCGASVFFTTIRQFMAACELGDADQPE